MEVYFIGTGGGAPSPHRGLPGLLVRREGFSILLDAGEGTQLRMSSGKLSITSLDVIAVTHMHADHVLGIPGIIQTMSLLGRTKKLFLMGPKALRDFLEANFKSTNFYPSFELEYTAQISKPLEVVPFPTCHTIESQGYLVKEPDSLNVDVEALRRTGVTDWRVIRRIKAGEKVNYAGLQLDPADFVKRRRGKVLAYTGDTRSCDQVIERVKGVDLLIHDSTFLEEPKASEYGHSTSRQAAEVASAAAVSRLALIHISSRYVDPFPLLREARRVFRESLLPGDMSKYLL